VSWRGRWHHSSLSPWRFPDRGSVVGLAELGRNDGLGMSERFHAKHSPLSAWEGKLLRKTTGCEEEEAALSVIGFAGCEGRHSRPLFETCQLPADFLHAPKPSGGAAKHRMNSVPVALPRECRSKPTTISSSARKVIRD